MENVKKSIIHAENVSKIFKLYNRRVDRLKETFLPAKKKSWYRPFHALKNVSFSITAGDTVGIIGRNGSGKSTLLQVICGIMQSSEGTMTVEGRISALLELGAGFNPEYSGRENVYFNASIMGVGKEEIDQRFGEIEEFADIGPFIDQPVKTYSSGMYVRLAFSVAIHVNPDILIVDEALAVGDALFQSKCFAKFREFQEKGVTVLFVTHSMDLVTRYCQKAILLEEGQLISSGSAKDVVDDYNRMIVRCGKPENQEKSDDLKSGEEKIKIPENDANKNISVKNSLAHLADDLPDQVAFKRNKSENRYGNGQAEIIDIGITSLNDISRHSFIHGEKYRFWMKVLFNEDIHNPVYAYTIKDVKGFDITGTNTYFQDIDTGLVKKGKTVLVYFDQFMMLNTGSYLMSFGCAGFTNGKYEVFDRRYDLIAFEVVSKKESVGMFDLASNISFRILDS